MLNKLSSDIRQYSIITGNYWAFTLTDGALRMLVVLHFHQLGYSPLDIALLFLFYEFFGVVTNLVGGWLGARIGLNKTMNAGLILQIIALSLLLVPTDLLTIAWVMLAQAISGIAKDLNKMSAKSAIKTLVPDKQQNTLYRWVAILTGSKNALKGLGFFIGGLLLTWLGFKSAVGVMAIALTLVCLLSIFTLKKELGKTKHKPKFTQIFSKNRDINILSAARFFLFGARDVWFVVALPVYLSSNLNWSHWQVGSFLAAWIMAYGIVQALAPQITQRTSSATDGHSLVLWAMALCFVPAAITLALTLNANPTITLMIGLLFFGILFAVNSSLHSYLIVSYARSEGASLDIGFYYMANAMGRLVGTLLSGWIFQAYGLSACLAMSAAFIIIAMICSDSLTKHRDRQKKT